MGDAAAGLDGGRLSHHDTEPAKREFAQMNEVEIAGDAVVGSVLHHRREDDAVG
jgi:hypothetical protein